MSNDLHEAMQRVPARNIHAGGPIPAAERVRKRVGLPIRAMSLMEIKETSASHVLGPTIDASLAGWAAAGIVRVSVTGSGISLEYPIGFTVVSAY